MLEKLKTQTDIDSDGNKEPNKISFREGDAGEAENYNPNFKLDLDKINNENNTLNSENMETNKYARQYSDITLTGPVDGISQILRKDSKLNLSISRISLKNSYPAENVNSKLRSIYKKVNNDSILNITNVKSSDNQFIKFFSNNSLYEQPKTRDSMMLNKAAAESLKDKKPAQTAKKLASDVINIYRENISNQIKQTNEKNEAKEIINKQTEQFRKITNQLVKKKHIPDVDVETIMRAPVQKYAKSHFPCNNNQTLASIVSKANITQINSNSRVLSPIKNFKEKFIEQIDQEEKNLNAQNVEETIKKSINRYEKIKPKTYQTAFIEEENINEAAEIEIDIEEENKEKEENNTQPQYQGIFKNKYKSLVEKIK